MNVTFAVWGLTIELANGTRQIVRFGGRDDTHAALRSDGSMARIREAGAGECPVILWDEAGAAPAAGAVSGSG